MQAGGFHCFRKKAVTTIFRLSHLTESMYSIWKKTPRFISHHRDKIPKTYIAVCRFLYTYSGIILLTP
jgi:hypothetical protein